MDELENKLRESQSDSESLIKWPIDGVSRDNTYIIAISDLHGYLPEIPSCDILLLGGDYNEKRNLDLQKRFMLGPFREWLESLEATFVVGIAGNHDFILQQDLSVAEELPWIYLQDHAVEINGVRIYGTPWTPEYGNWAFMMQENKLKSIYSKIPRNLDILLSHGPIKGILDREQYGAHCGSKELLYKVKEVKPDTVICGHIHEANGVFEEAGTRYYNVSYCNEWYEPVNYPKYIPLVREDTDGTLVRE